MPSETQKSQPDFYDYYDYVEIRNDEKEANRRSNLGFFPEVSFSDSKVKERPQLREILDRNKNRGKLEEDQSSFSNGRWVKPPSKEGNKPKPRPLRHRNRLHNRKVRE